MQSSLAEWQSVFIIHNRQAEEYFLGFLQKKNVFWVVYRGPSESSYGNLPSIS